jgi:hypothetical protein
MNFIALKMLDDIKPLRDTDVQRVRGTEGIEWAVGLYKGTMRVRLEDGTFQSCVVIGLDDETLIGGPPQDAGRKTLGSAAERRGDRCAGFDRGQLPAHWSIIRD